MTYNPNQYNPLSAPFPARSRSASEAKEMIKSAMRIWKRMRFNRLTLDMVEKTYVAEDQYLSADIRISDDVLRAAFLEFLDDAGYGVPFELEEEGWLFVQEPVDDGDLIDLGSSDELLDNVRSGNICVPGFDEWWSQYRDGAYPTFGWVYEFHGDYGWSQSSLDVASAAGFTVFQPSDLDAMLNPLLGINGGGYNFEAEHWMPFFLGVESNANWKAAAEHFGITSWY